MGELIERLRDRLSQKYRDPFRADHLADPDLLRRLTGEVVGNDNASGLVASRPSKRRRRPTLVTVAKQAERAGIAVARYEVDADGKITIISGQPEATPNPESNEWDTVQ
jgi:hypothetical protein